MSQIAAFVVGASGYVGGELLRLIAAHPTLELAGAVSRKGAVEQVGDVFPHLASTLPDTPFVALDDAIAAAQDAGAAAVFSAAPHGHSAAVLARFAALGNKDLHIVDVSADFRFNDRAQFEAIYGVEHGAADLMREFSAAPPELLPSATTQHVGHPGCFATAMLLAAAPLVAAGLAGTEVFLTGITGSTGSGKTPLATTHHPERHNNLYAYKPLSHRHAPEVESVLAACHGSAPTVRFVPHSGPFARGILMNLQARTTRPVTADELTAVYARYYEQAPFVRLRDGGARLKNVTGSNYAEIALASDGASVAVSCVIDNLVKGAAGGAMQWMNRLHGLDETTGLTAPATGWS